jgi:hypothetical protein
MCRDRMDSGGDDQEELADLRWHWDLAYEISISGDTWTARFLGVDGSQRAGSAGELRGLIRADYASRKATAVSGGEQTGTPDDAIGAGERALRRLLDEGLI